MSLVRYLDQMGGGGDRGIGSVLGIWIVNACMFAHVNLFAFAFRRFEAEMMSTLFLSGRGGRGPYISL